MSITIDHLKDHLQTLVNNRDSYAQAFQQTLGAISTIEQQIKMIFEQNPQEPVPEHQEPVSENNSRPLADNLVNSIVDSQSGDANAS